MNGHGDTLAVVRGQSSGDGRRSLNRQTPEELPLMLSNRTKNVAKSVAFGVNVYQRSQLVEDESDMVTVA